MTVITVFTEPKDQHFKQEGVSSAVLPSAREAAPVPAIRSKPLPFSQTLPYFR